MKTLVKRMHGNQKGFTLIELLVVIAILGVISAVVALNLGGFFGEGTLQAANTELHQVQTAVIAAMAECRIGSLEGDPGEIIPWHGGPGQIVATGGCDAATFVYGPFRATYHIATNGTITQANYDGMPEDRENWGEGITWCGENRNWRAAG